MVKKPENVQKPPHLELRCRFLLAIIWIIGIGLIQHIIAVILAAFFILFLIFVMRLPSRLILRNIIIVSPFLIISFATLLFSEGFPITTGAFDFAALLAARILGCVLALVLVMGNEIGDYLAAFKGMRFPETLTSTLFLAQRYVHLIGQELGAMRNALVSRLFTPRLRARTLKMYGRILGGMSIKAIDRSEHVRKAMDSRGFNGTMPSAQPQPIQKSDIIKTAAAILPLLLILIAEFIFCD